MNSFFETVQPKIVFAAGVIALALAIVAGCGRPAAARPATSTPTRPVTATAIPTPTPTPTPTPRPPVIGVDSYTTTVTLPTYPFRDFLVEQLDPLYNMPVYYFNRPAYEAEPRQPAPVDYTGVVLENKYLRLTFLPQLGGRLYSAVVKPTGQEIFYHNPVVKPSRYGVLQPYEANWWLASGGMEWAYPVQEHGYRFGLPWDYRVTQSATGAAITLADSAPHRTGLTVTVSLPVDSASFSVTPRLTNNAAITVPVQVWTNAALALSSGSMSPDTQFVVPTGVITIHSRGELGWSLPDAGRRAAWPLVGQTDLRDYRQWANYLGFFVANTDAPFMGAFNAATKLGVVRLPESGRAGKLFAFSAGFPDRSYTDDDSQYFELWGGANNGFWPEDDIPVAPGQSLGWTELWWPLAGLPGLTWATEHVAIALEQNKSTATLSALVARPVTGQVRVTAAGALILNERFSANPARPLSWPLAAGAGPLTIEFTDANGGVLLTYQTN